MYGLYGGSSLYTFSFYKFHQCDTVTPNPECYSQSKIDQIFRGTFFEYVYLSYLSTSFQNDPRIPTLQKERNSVSNLNRQRFWHGLHHVEYNSDFGILFESKETVKFFNVEFYKQTFAPLDLPFLYSGKTSFIQLSFENHKTITIYERNFTKAQQLLANIGGMINGIMVIAEIIYYTFGNKMMFLKIYSFFTFSTKAKMTTLNSKNLLLNNFIKDKVNDLSIDKVIPKRRFESVNDILNEKIKLSFFQKYFFISCGKSSNIHKYNQSVTYIKKTLSLESFINLKETVGLLKDALFCEKERNLLEFYLMNKEKIGFLRNNENFLNSLLNDMCDKPLQPYEKKLYSIIESFK